jgi:uncharacterized membrane protein YphA (DoxX/SURF4 family)
VDGIFLQRLFSTFPDGWPGVGLLVLRLGAAVSLVYSGTTGLFNGSIDAAMTVRFLIEFVGGLLLLAGLWTPAAGSVVAIEELWVAASQQPGPPGMQWMHTLLAVLAAGVAMIGPGAWSVDSRLFGRQRF